MEASDPIDNVEAKIQEKEGNPPDQHDSDNGDEKLTNITQEGKELLNWMQTEDYYKTHGGNGPDWKEGGELMKEYLKMTDSLGIERKNTLIVKFNEICKANSLRGILEDSKAKTQAKKDKLGDNNDEKYGDGTFDWKALLKNSPEEFQDCESNSDNDRDSTAAGSSVQTFQIFIKPLAGNRMTLEVASSYNVDFVTKMYRSKIDDLGDTEMLVAAERLMWDNNRIKLIFEGKSLEASRTIGSYGIVKDSELKITSVLSGEGTKRGNSSREDQSKDGAIDEIERTLQKCVTEVGTLDGLELLQGTVANLNTHIDATKQNPDAVKILLAQMDKTSLLRILTALETNNGDAKLANLKNTFYKTEVGQIRTVNDKTKSILEAFWHSINYMLTSAFSNETGRIQWSVLKQEVLNQVSLRDQAIGAQAARHG